MNHFLITVNIECFSWVDQNSFFLFQSILNGPLPGFLQSPVWLTVVVSSTLNHRFIARIVDRVSICSQDLTAIHELSTWIYIVVTCISLILLLGLLLLLLCIRILVIVIHLLLVLRSSILIIVYICSILLQLLVSRLKVFVVHIISWHLY